MLGHGSRFVNVKDAVLSICRTLASKQKPVPELVNEERKRLTKIPLKFENGDESTRKPNRNLPII
jgi:hypothetical protein